MLVGDSAKARKGSSFDHVARLLAHADPAFTARLTTGLSSGEGLIWAVRDPQGPDPGAVDKRLLVIEPEFATVLKSTGRELSTLSPTLRSAWDGRPLALLTRTAPARATEAHISIIGHITQTELRRHTTTVEIANGFLNRFIFAAVRRVRLLPEGGDPDPLKGTGLGRYLTSVLKHAHTAGKVTLTPDARELWWHTYPQLTQPADGLLGQLTARAEAHVIRLALLYALLDGQKTIQPEHLHPRSRSGTTPNAPPPGRSDRRPATRSPSRSTPRSHRSPDGLTRTQIRDLCQRNLPADRVEQALATLAAAGRASQQRTLTGGRPAELWTAASPRRLTRHRYARVGRIARPSRPRPPATPREPRPPSWRAITSESEAVSTRDAQPHAPRPGRPSLQPFPHAAPLWSFGRSPPRSPSSMAPSSPSSVSVNTRAQRSVHRCARRPVIEPRNGF